MKMLATLLSLCFTLLFTQTILADTNDALAPKSSPADALTEQLHTITVTTASLEESLLFYRDGMGLSLEGPLALDADTLALQKRLWGVEGDIKWNLYRLYRKGAEGAAQIRLLVLNQATPAMHKTWSALELGPFSMGFPNGDQINQDKKLRKLGFGALNEIEIYEVPRPDKSRYPIHETIFNGPDFVHGVGIFRGDGMSQLGPIDNNKLGGPAYSAQVIENSDKVLAFYTDVLGMELRSDRIWKSAGSKGALNVPDGTVFRFSIVYAKGAKSGHMLFVDYQNVEAIDPGVTPRIPNRGIGLWTYPVKDLDEVLARARNAEIEILHAPVIYNSPTLGKVRVASIVAPNNFIIELFERKDLQI